MLVLIYYLKNVGIGFLCGFFVLIALFGADCFDGNLTARFGSGTGGQEKSAFVAINDATDMYCRENSLEAQRNEVQARAFQVFGLVLLNTRLNVSTEILVGAMLVAFAASITRRKGALTLSQQLKVVVAATMFGCILIAMNTEYDCLYNYANGTKVWTDAIWSAVNLSNKCMLLGLLALALATALKDRSAPRKTLLSPIAQNRRAVLVPMHERRREQV